MGTQIQEYLMRLGLTKYKSQAMEVLFEGESLTAKEISTEGKVPYTKVYNELERLEQLGVVRYTMDTPRVYHALKPDVVFSTLLENQKKEVKKLEDLQEDVLEQTSIAWSDVKEKEFESKMWMYQNPSVILEAVGEIMNSAKREVLATGSKDALFRAWKHPASMLGISNLAKRKVIHRAVYTTKVMPGDILKLTQTAPFLSSVKNLYHLISALKSDYYKIRVIPEEKLQMEFIVVDGKEAGLSWRNDKGTAQWGIRVQNRNISRFMTDYFERLWEDASPVGKKWYEGVKGK